MKWKIVVEEIIHEDRIENTEETTSRREVVFSLASNKRGWLNLIGFKPKVKKFTGPCALQMAHNYALMNSPLFDKSFKCEIDIKSTYHVNDLWTKEVEKLEIEETDMTLANTMKERIKDAMRQKNVVERDILRVALGEVQLIEAKEGEVSDERVHKIIRKIIAGNDEVLAIRHADKLVEENQILESFLPKMWTEEQIRAHLSEDAQSLREVKSDGQATGVAIKSLQAVGASVDGKLVKQVVADLRAQ